MKTLKADQIWEMLVPIQYRLSSRVLTKNVKMKERRLC